MSDDTDWHNWFEEVEWTEDLIDAIRALLRDPVTATFEQVRGFASEVSQILKEAGGEKRLDLRLLESAVRSHDLTTLSVASVFTLVGMARQHADQESSRRDSLSQIPIAKLSSVVRPKVGQVRLGDVVGLAKLAARQQHGVDVFERLTLDLTVGYLSQSALRTLTFSELREALEGLASAKILRDQR
jgi:hypothetical protein